MARPPSERRTAIADAAVAVLASRGLRGLTHRAVDAEAGLPPGSTSYYVRTRAALVALVLERLAEVDLGGRDRPGGTQSLPPAPSAQDVVEVVLGGLLAQLGTAREQVVARYELTLEAVRDEQVREALQREGGPFREVAIGLMRAAASADPDRHGRTLVAFCEGVLFDSVVGAGAERALSANELRASLTEVVEAMLAGR